LTPADVVIRGEKGTFDLKKWVASRRNEQFEWCRVATFNDRHFAQIRGLSSNQSRRSQKIFSYRLTPVAIEIT
jgi:hypothetical protein